MRSEKSVKNSLYAIVSQAVSLIFGFVTRIVFASILGDEYLGLNNIFYSVLSLLSLTELGMGAAFTFALYGPIAEDDRERIGRVMNLYAVAYRIVAGVVAVIGLCLVPFLPLITESVPDIQNITGIYLLFLTNSAASYLFSYKRALITASQQDYKNSVNISIFSILQNAAQLVLLITTGSFMLYLTAQLVCTVASNLAISRTAGRMFPYLSKIKGLPERTELDTIKKNVKAMFMTRFGSVAVTGTDNLLIATVGVALVGVYSNYLLLVQTVQTVLLQVVNAVTASVGNLLAEGSRRKLEIYKNIIFAVAWLYGFSAIALDTLMGRFVFIVFGGDWLLAETAVHIMAANFLIAGIRQTNQMFINAGGLFEPVKWRGFTEAAVNLGVSALFLFVFDMGLIGVLLGTTVSHLTVGIVWETLAVDRHCAAGAGAGYLFRNLIYAAVIVGVRLINGAVCALIPQTLLGFIVAVAITAVLPNVLFLILSARTPELAFLAGVAKRMAAKVIRSGK